MARTFSRCYGHLEDGEEVNVFTEVIPHAGRRIRVPTRVIRAPSSPPSGSLLERRSICRPDLDLGALRYMRERLTLALPSRQVSDPRCSSYPRSVKSSSRGFFSFVYKLFLVWELDVLHMRDREWELSWWLDTCSSCIYSSFLLSGVQSRLERRRARRDWWGRRLCSLFISRLSFSCSTVFTRKVALLDKGSLHLLLVLFGDLGRLLRFVAVGYLSPNLSSGSSLE